MIVEAGDDVTCLSPASQRCSPNFVGRGAIRDRQRQKNADQKYYFNPKDLAVHRKPCPLRSEPGGRASN